MSWTNELRKFYTWSQSNTRRLYLFLVEARDKIDVLEAGGGEVAAHASTHEPGGADALTIDAAAGTGSLRTLGTSGTSACAGNDGRLSDARTPSAHASTHALNGSDPVASSAALDLLLYGSGRDGDMVFDGVSSVTISGASVAPSGGVYTLTANVYADDVTMSGCTIALAGFRLLARGTLTASGTNVIHDDGNDASGTTAGTFLSNASSSTGRSATAGGNGRNTVGNGSNGGNGSLCDAGRGGSGGSSGGNSGGSAGTITPPTSSQSVWYGPLFMFGLAHVGGSSANLQSFVGGTGGGGGGVSSIGASGGGGSGGGFASLHARTITNSGTLTVRAKGGNGAAATSGDAGGGGGGGGGYVEVVATVITGTTPVLSAAGGSAGAGFGAGNSGSAGSAGRTRLVVGSSLTET